MEIEISKKTAVNAKTLKIHLKVVDQFSYSIEDDKGVEIFDQEDGYVPALMPGDHYGDYLILNIDIDTGVITNWRKNVPGLYEDAINTANDNQT